MMIFVIFNVGLISWNDEVFVIFGTIKQGKGGTFKIFTLNLVFLKHTN